MDFVSAKKHFDEIRKEYEDLEGVKGVNTSLALRMIFDPLAKRFNSGERTEVLYFAMMAVE